MVQLLYISKECLRLTECIERLLCLVACIQYLFHRGVCFGNRYYWGFRWSHFSFAFVTGITLWDFIRDKLIHAWPIKSCFQQLVIFYLYSRWLDLCNLSRTYILIFGGTICLPDFVSMPFWIRRWVETRWSCPSVTAISCTMLYFAELIIWSASCSLRSCCTKVSFLIENTIYCFL